MKLTIRIPGSGPLEITLDASDSVSTLKEKIYSQKQIPIARQRLLFAGKELIDANTLSSYGMADGAGIMLVLRPETSNLATPTSSIIIDATENPQVSSESPKVQQLAPKFPPEVDQCWNAAYVSDWPKTRQFLDSDVSLDQLEQRCKKQLVEFFTEREMFDAILYLETKRGSFSPNELYIGLCAATTVNSSKLIDLFISRGATAALCQSENRIQPLHLAVLYRKPKLVSQFLSMGFSPNHLCSQSNTFMEVSGAISFTPSIAFFGQASRNNRYEEKDTIPTLSALFDHPEFNINAVDAPGGNTILHYAVKGFAKEIIRFILSYEPDITIKNSEGLTARQIEQRPNADQKLMQNEVEAIFKLFDNGKIRSRKRKTPESSLDSSEPPAKSAKVETFSFHTLDSESALLSEWTVGSEDQNPNRDIPLETSIETDFEAILSEKIDDDLHRASVCAQKVSKALDGVFVITEAQSHWIPFVVRCPTSRGRNQQISSQLLKTIGAEKAKVITRKIQAKSKNAFDKIVVERAGDWEQQMQDATELLRAETRNLSEIRFPGTYKSSAAFVCGVFSESDDATILCGVYAVLVEP